MSLVYYVLDATRDNQRVKIGITTNLVERLKILKNQTSSGQYPTILAFEEGGIEVEQERHERFRACRLSGEWFEYGPNDPDDVTEHLHARATAQQDLYVWIGELENPTAFIMDREHLWPDAAGWNGLPYTTKAGPPDRMTSLSLVESDEEETTRPVAFHRWLTSDD